MGWLGRQIVLRTLSTYHRFISPVLPRACRFFPSCSVYASDAIRKHGLVKGTWLSLRRLGRCHPWNPGGYDPVN